MTVTLNPPVSTDATHPHVRTRQAIQGQVTAATLLRSEWIKLTTVRSTLITYAAAVSVAVGLGALFAHSAGTRGPSEALDSASLSLAGFHLAELIFGVLGVVAVTSEYSSGLVHTSLAAARSRWSILAAKLTVFSATTLVLSTFAAFTAFFVGNTIYRGTTPVAIGDPGAFRMIAATAGFCVAVGIFGTALGFLLRSTAAAIGVLVGGLFILPGLAGLLPWAWSKSLTKILPGSAGDAITTLRPGTDMLSPAMAALALAGWSIGLIIAAAVVLERRDA